MKIEKGNPGYLKAQRKIEIIKVSIAFALVIAIFVAGYVTTKTRLNLMTVVAILGCLPASKILVGVITRWPYRSIDASVAQEIQSHTQHLVVAYDMVVTSESKIMPIDSIVIYGNTVCGYTHSEKVDLNYAAKHIKSILEKNDFHNLTVKIFDNYKAFITRAEGLESIAVVEKLESREREERMKAVILCISL